MYVRTARVGADRPLKVTELLLGSTGWPVRSWEQVGHWISEQLPLVLQLGAQHAPKLQKQKTLARSQAYAARNRTCAGAREGCPRGFAVQAVACLRLSLSRGMIIQWTDLNI